MTTKTKKVQLAFTGVIAVNPAYNNASGTRGPIKVVMPTGTHRARTASFDANSSDANNQTDARIQIDAHYAYAVFPWLHLVQQPAGVRLPDFVFPNEERPEQAVCFFENEIVELITPSPTMTDVTFDETPPFELDTYPPDDAKHAGWIARWNQFAPNGNVSFRAPNGTDPLTDTGRWVRLEIPGGHISSNFVCKIKPRTRFDYDGLVTQSYFAHEIVVTLEYPEEQEDFRLSTRETLEIINGPSELVFTWGDADEFKIVFGNGSFASVLNVLNGTCAGHIHPTHFDHEFELFYDVISCDIRQNRKPVPETTSDETRHIPCLATML